MAPSTPCKRRRDQQKLIKTTILADDQQTVALGGLMRDNSTYGQQKVPGLGDVPVLSNLFRSKSKNSDKTNLIVFLQPTILRNGTAVASVTEKVLKVSAPCSWLLTKMAHSNNYRSMSTPCFPIPPNERGAFSLPANDLVTPASKT